MNETEEKKVSIDILKHLEYLSNNVNKIMATRTQVAFGRYPVTFALLILIGVIAVHEGLKGVMKSFGILEINPWYLVVFGLVVLTITGTLYKKLDK